MQITEDANSALVNERKKNATLLVYMKQKLCHHSFLKSISNSHIVLSFVFIWN